MSCLIFCLRLLLSSLFVCPLAIFLCARASWAVANLARRFGTLFVIFHPWLWSPWPMRDPIRIHPTFTPSRNRKRRLGRELGVCDTATTWVLVSRVSDNLVKSTKKLRDGGIRASAWLSILRDVSLASQRVDTSILDTWAGNNGSNVCTWRLNFSARLWPLVHTLLFAGSVGTA